MNTEPLDTSQTRPSAGGRAWGSDAARRRSGSATAIVLGVVFSILFAAPMAMVRAIVGDSFPLSYSEIAVSSGGFASIPISLWAIWVFGERVDPPLKRLWNWVFG